MSTYLTAKLKLPVPNDDDPYQQGARRIRELGEALDASTGAAWTNLVLASGWVTQATFPVPQYRVAGGVCQLRGTVRYASGVIPGTSVIFNAPAPGGGGTAATSVLLSAVAYDLNVTSALDKRVVINPRSDGVARCLNSSAGSGTAAWVVALDGLFYSV